MNKSEKTIEEDTLLPSKGLFQERWDIFKRNRMAYASFWFLMFLLALAFLGKLLTRFIVIFDPKIVREKWNSHLSKNQNWQHQLWDILMFQAWLEAN